MAEMTMTVDINDLDEDMQKFAKDIKTLPKRDNPLVEWRVGYGHRTAKEKQPTVTKGGTFRGNKWKKLSPNTIGNVAEGKGRKRGKNKSRYKTSTTILGDQGGDGLLGDWANSDPVLSDGNKVLRITSKKDYARAHALGNPKGNLPARPWWWGKKIEKEEAKALLKEFSKYIGKQLKRRIK